MGTVNMLLITKGHPFDRGPFFDLFDALPDVNFTHVEQPAARLFYNPDNLQDYDVLVFYDMPGIEFQPGKPVFEVPDEKLKRDWQALLASGKGLVFLHHAIAGWPAWPEYAETIGGRFLYMPSSVRGEERPDSGYRHELDHSITPVTDHPVTQSIPANFEMNDELYLYEVFEDSVTPLLTSDYEFVRDNFYSATRVVRDGVMFDREGWSHEPGSNLVGWAKSADQCPVVYLQGGDDPRAYGNEHYRQLIANAVHWTASEEARQWAAQTSAGR